jgi:hypothetical protein
MCDLIQATMFKLVNKKRNRAKSVSFISVVKIYSMHHLMGLVLAMLFLITIITPFSVFRNG